MKYGIFGGTFDPFTRAHYEIVNRILSEGLVDKVIVIPTIVDYYRKDKDRMFSNEQRLTLIEKWFANRSDVVIDDYEYRLAAVDETTAHNVVPDGSADRISERRYWHMLQDLMKRYGDNEYVTVIGADSWNNITNWFNFRELGTATDFIVVRRAGQPVNFYVNYPEYHSQPHNVVDLGEAYENISASETRKRLCDAKKDSELNRTEFDIYSDEIENSVIPASSVRYEKLLVHTPIFNLVETRMAGVGFNPVQIKSPEWVSIIVERDGKFLMIKQLRYGLEKEFEEFPCGMVEENEDIVRAGLRELEEETGFRILDSRTVHYLGKLAANPAFMTNYMHYLHVNLDYALYDETEQKLDPHERIQSYWVDKNKAFDTFIESNGSAIMGSAWVFLMKNKIV